MNNISSFFGKIFKKISDDEKIRNEIFSILKEKTNSSLNDDAIVIKEGVIFIRTHPMIKQEILLHKKDIVEAIQKKVGEVITDLR